ncbi:hypothetical protein KM043_007224 [Ampulex compressa]|nr:hypothetical protein KM043_007224 [Ampulex compressa]
MNLFRRFTGIELSTAQHSVTSLTDPPERLLGHMEVPQRGWGRGSRIRPSQNAAEAQTLRRPHVSTIAQNSGDNRSLEENKSEHVNLHDIVKNSTLSVDAAEFIPKDSALKAPVRQMPAQSRPKYSAQNRIDMVRDLPNHVQLMATQYSANNYDIPEGQHRYENPIQHQNANQHANVEAYDRYNTGAGDYNNRHQGTRVDEKNNSLDLTNMLLQLKRIMHDLIWNPGYFGSLVPPLIVNIRHFFTSPSQFQEIIRVIIQESINEGNFRYSGARLCVCLDACVDGNEQASFRETLNVLCKEEMQRQAIAWQKNNDHTDEAQRKCHGLILFLAELVAQMKDGPAFCLGELLVQLITVVLKKPAPNSVKHICQALKLAGQTLERDKRGSRKEMENMMRALTELVTEGRVDSHVGRMVHSVHELRNGNWGQGTSNHDSSMVETKQVTESQGILDEPVFYGPDGQVLSPEETKFLQDFQTELEILDNERDADDADIEDDEIFEAYEEFLKTLPHNIENKMQD